MKKVSKDNIKYSIFYILADIFTLVPGVILSDVLGRFIPLSGFLLLLMSAVYLLLHGLIMGFFTKKYAERQIYYDEISHTSFGISLAAGELIRIVLANMTIRNTMFTLPAFYIYCLFQPSLPEDIFMVDYTQNRMLFILLQLLFSIIHAVVLYFIYKRTIDKNYVRTEAVLSLEEEQKLREKRMKSYEKASTSTGDYVKECFMEGLMLFIYAFIIGTVSNVVLLFVGYLTSIPFTVHGNSEGYSESLTMLVWFVLALVGMVICTVFTFLLAGEVGRSGAQFTKSRNNSLKLDKRIMCFSVAGGIGVYIVLTMVVALNAMFNLFFAGPVQYIARFIGKGERSIYIEDAFDFGDDVIAAAVLIYAAILVAGVIFGYIRGQRKFVNKTVEDEKHSDVRKPSSADTVPETYQPKSSQPRESRTSFTEREMEAWRRLNNRKLTSIWGLLILYAAFIVFIWFLWGKSQGNYFSPGAVAFTLLLILPFYPFRIQNRLFGRSYYAEVVRCELPPKFETLVLRRMGSKARVEFTLYLRLRNGTSTTLKLDPDGSAEAAYVPGETVYKLSAFRFPVKCTLYPDEQFCPGCGNHFPKKRSVCPRCKLRVTPKEKY